MTGACAWWGWATSCEATTPSACWWRARCIGWSRRPTCWSAAANRPACSRRSRARPRSCWWTPSPRGPVPATIHRFDASDAALPLASGASTHDLGLSDAIELGRALDLLPARLVVLGIEGRTFELGAPLSPEVARAADDVVAELRGTSPADPPVTPCGGVRLPLTNRPQLGVGLNVPPATLVPEWSGGPPSSSTEISVAA